MRTSKMFKPIILPQSLVMPLPTSRLSSGVQVPMIQQAPALSYIQQPMPQTIIPTPQPTAQSYVPTVSQIMAQTAVQPIAQPTIQTTVQPVVQPTIQPVVQPVIQPMIQPIVQQQMVQSQLYGKPLTPSPSYEKYIPPTPITSTPLGSNIIPNMFQSYQYAPIITPQTGVSSPAFTTLSSPIQNVAVGTPKYGMYSYV